MKKTKKLRGPILFFVVLLIVAAVLIVTFVVQKLSGGVSRKITMQEAQDIVNDTIASLPRPVSDGAKLLAQQTEVTVNDMKYGTEKDIVLSCNYRTKDVLATVRENIGDYMSAAYNLDVENAQKGLKTNATKVKLLVSELFESDLQNAQELSGEIELTLYEINEGEFSLYLSDETVNTLLGGIIDARALIDGTETVMYQGSEVSISGKNTLRTGIKDCMALSNYDSKKPDTAVGLVRVWNKFKFDFYRNFIVNRQWTYLTNGLFNTLRITVLAVLLGILIGFVVAVIRVTNQKTGNLELLSFICRIYVTVMRGVPLMVQLLIMYFVILLPNGVEKFTAAVLCFGLNSGAYVSEIVRGGIMSIDAGQTEAGRSLGLNYVQTMYYIVIPQAFKAVLPSLANEFITLLKESSVAFYIGVADLTLGALKIRSITYSSFMPLIAAALIYLVMVLVLSKGVSILERRLSEGDKR